MAEKINTVMVLNRKPDNYSGLAKLIRNHIVCLSDIWESILIDTKFEQSKVVQLNHIDFSKINGQEILFSYMANDCSLSCHKGKFYYIVTVSLPRHIYITQVSIEKQLKNLFTAMQDNGIQLMLTGSEIDLFSDVKNLKSFYKEIENIVGCTEFIISSVAIDNKIINKKFRCHAEHGLNIYLKE
ncbi:MAG: hypothetical protein ABUK01_18005 [Leptospirales bacterium]